MSRISLSPDLYNCIQNVVHRGHRNTFDLLTRLMEVSPGERVVDVGCGTGILARHFVEHGYDYWGIDRDPDRIAAARQQTPGAHFLVCDALALDRAALPQFRHAFIHGVLHHLDGSQCQHLIDRILSFSSDMILAVIEPFRPRRWWTNPLRTLVSCLDEGRFVRSLQEWRDLFGPRIDVFATRSLWPPWPVCFVDARLVANQCSVPKQAPTRSGESEQTGWARRRVGK